MSNISLPLFVGLGLLAAGSAATSATGLAASCGTMGFGETAGSVTVEAFLGSIETELSKRPGAAGNPVQIDTITFGLG